MAAWRAAEACCCCQLVDAAGGDPVCPLSEQTSVAGCCIWAQATELALQRSSCVAVQTSSPAPGGLEAGQPMAAAQQPGLAAPPLGPAIAAAAAQHLQLLAALLGPGRSAAPPWLLPSLPAPPPRCLLSEEAARCPTRLRAAHPFLPQTSTSAWCTTPRAALWCTASPRRRPRTSCARCVCVCVCNWGGRAGRGGWGGGGAQRTAHRRTARGWLVVGAAQEDQREQAATWLWPHPPAGAGLACCRARLPTQRSQPAPACRPPPRQVKRMAFGKGGVPHIGTHDGRTVRYPDPEIKVSNSGPAPAWLSFEPWASWRARAGAPTGAPLPGRGGRPRPACWALEPRERCTYGLAPPPHTGERHRDAGPGERQDQGLHQV